MHAPAPCPHTTPMKAACDASGEGEEGSSSGTQWGCGEGGRGKASKCRVLHTERITWPQQAHHLRAAFKGLYLRYLLAHGAPKEEHHVILKNTKVKVPWPPRGASTERPQGSAQAAGPEQSPQNSLPAPVNDGSAPGTQVLGGVGDAQNHGGFLQGRPPGQQARGQGAPTLVRQGCSAWAVGLCCWGETCFGGLLSNAHRAGHWAQPATRPASQNKPSFMFHTLDLGLCLNSKVFWCLGARDFSPPPRLVDII